MLRGVRAKRRKRIAARGRAWAFAIARLARAFRVAGGPDGHGVRDSRVRCAALCVLVTGATGGIGRELCAELARDHGVLALVGRSQDKLDELAKNLAERFGVGVRTFVADFAQPGAVDALASQVQAANLQVETLVNNAGFGYDAPFAESSLERPTRAWCRTNDMALMEALPCVRTRHGGARARRHPQCGQRAGFVPGRTCPRTTLRRRSSSRSQVRCIWSCARTACM